jgi:hypothetical protein
MKTFIEWLEANNDLDENWKKWLSTAALAGSMALPSIGCNGPDCSIKDKAPSKYHQYFHSPEKERAKQELRNKTNQIIQAQGEFNQGQLQPDSIRSQRRDSKTIRSQKATSPDADEYL